MPAKTESASAPSTTLRAVPLPRSAALHGGGSPQLAASFITLPLGDYVAANFITLIASKFCTPPPTRLVV